MKSVDEEVDVLTEEAEQKGAKEMTDVKQQKEDKWKKEDKEE